MGTRRPREHGWRNPDGVTHHIETRRVNAYHSYMRTATCGADLRGAARARFDTVNCMTCVVRVSRRPRLPPRAPPDPHTPSWWINNGTRHERSENDPWSAICGASLRKAQRSGHPPNCILCGHQPSALDQIQSLRDAYGIRHEMCRDREVVCGADLTAAQFVRREPNCPACEVAATKAKERNRERPQHRRRTAGRP